MMFGKVVIAKYGDPGSPIMTIKINNLLIEKSLIYLGEAINAMTKETMENIFLSGSRSTPTLL